MAVQEQDRPGSARASRRTFVQTMGLATTAGLTGIGPVHAGGKEEIKVAVIGCGGRGSGAAENAIAADPRVRIVGLGDVFSDRVQGLQGRLTKFENQKGALKSENCFVGFDAYQKVLALDLDYVILATPPHFRPIHFKAAIEAGKHVFMEKPVAVDPVGCRSVIEMGEVAKTKNLSVVAGTQRRHQAEYLESIQRIQDGQIGKILAARCYWNQGQLWYRNRGQNWSAMEWMIRDWVNWTWLSGDHIVEQHVHNLDVVNWFTGKHPVRAVGMGGRAQRVTGDQYDYFAVDYEFDDGMHSASQCRQVNGCDQNVSEAIVGERGRWISKGGIRIEGAKPWRVVRRRGDKLSDPYVQEHVDLIDSIIYGKKLNEARNVATSTLTAVMGRIAAYTGKVVTWDEMMKSELRLGPAEYNWEVKLFGVQLPRAGVA